MEFILLLLFIILTFIILILLLKIRMLHKSMEELRSEFAARLREDTNVGISLSTGDKKMNLLAADINRQLQLLRKAQLRYINGNQEVKHAITNISHDLRTPLTAIRGYMDLLEQEKVSPQAEEYLKIIHNRVQALTELTEELFQYSIIVSADSCQPMEPISLNQALEESFAGHYTLLKDAGIEPVIHMPDTIVTRTLNRQALSRILSNIISNAVKYSDGDLRVTLEGTGILRFQNKAKQFDKIQAEHLFDRFYTVESGRNSTGLGLAIARTLTEEMGGSIEATYQKGELELRIFFRE